METGSFALLRRLFRHYMRPHLWRLAVAVPCMAIMAACTAAFTRLVQPLIDDGFIGQDSQVMINLPLLLIGLTLLKGIATFLQGYLMEYVGQRVVADLQKDLYKSVLHQDLGFFQKHPSSSLTSRFTYDLNRLNQAISNIVGGGLRDLTMVIGLTITLLLTSWKLALVATVLFPLAIVPIRQFGRLMRKYARLAQERIGTLANQLGETFTHNRQVKAFTTETYEIGRAKQRIADVFAATMRAARIRAVASPVIELAGVFTIVLVIYAALYLTRTEGLTTGAFAAFLVAVIALIRPIKGLSNLNNALQEGLAAASRTFELIDQQSAITDASKAKALTLKKADVELKNITVTYPDGTCAIDDISFKIGAGETVALVGLSGAGKTTLLNLIPRFFDPTQGTVDIDGQDVKNVTLKSLRENIALVSQEVAIFDDTIAANIAYGRPDVSLKDIQKAAKDAAAHTFIAQLENGYETCVGENGVKLSGGQRQRIAIARAMLKNAPILLMDEATSALDTQSERQVQTALKKLMKGRTTLVIAHRLSTIMHATKICVVEGGKIVESGTHKNLLKKKGIYAHLHKMQSGEH